MPPLWVELAKLLAAAAAGALIGLERETHDKPAGFRTNILICLGAALFTVVSARMAGPDDADRTRIAAQIVTGVGFLGAGAIIQYRGGVVGLTTAATIWVVASVGMAFGAGEFVLGTIGTLLTTVVLFGLGVAEDRIAHWRTVASFEIEFAPGTDAPATVEHLLAQAGVRRRSWTVSRTAESVTGCLTVAGPIARLAEFEQVLAKDPAVRGFKRL